MFVRRKNILNWNVPYIIYVLFIKSAIMETSTDGYENNEYNL